MISLLEVNDASTVRDRESPYCNGVSPSLISTCCGIIRPADPETSKTEEKI